MGIDLDQINLSWVRRLLPATAVVIGMRYNSQLIDEVIGVAQATFAPEAKLANRAITDDSSSEVKVDKAGDNAQKTDEQAEQTDAKNTDTADKNAKNSDKTKADKSLQSNRPLISRRSSHILLRGALER